MNGLKQLKEFLPILILSSVVILLVWIFKIIFLYILISFILASILKKPVDFINRIHVINVCIPKTIAIITSYLLLLALIGLLLSLFVPLFLHQFDIFSEIKYRNIYKKIFSYIIELEKFIERIGFSNINIRSNLKDGIIENIAGFLKENFSDLVNNFISVTGNFLIGFLAVTFITFFLLHEQGIIKKFFISLIPNGYFEASIAAINKTQILLTNYLFGLAVQMISVFCIVTVGMLLIGVKNYALIIGLFSALTNLIPFVGPTLGCTFGLFVSFSTIHLDSITWNSIFWILTKVFSVFAIVQLIDNILLQPFIFSKSVKAHPLEIFFVVFVGASLSGALGMILAIPSYTVLKVSYAEFYKGYRQYKSFKAIL